VIGSEDSQVSDLVCVIGQAGCARLLEARMKDMAVATLDHPRSNGHAQFERTRVVQAIQPIVQVAVAIAHRGFLVDCNVRFQMGL
jgi:hypothetical protein